MASVATQTAPVYVQQAFLWDETDSGSSNPGQMTTSSAISPTNSQVTVRPSARPPVTAPSVRATSSVRRERCEHVGGILATVLERYGIGIDQLIAEIDGLK